MGHNRASLLADAYQTLAKRFDHSIHMQPPPRHLPSPVYASLLILLLAAALRWNQPAWIEFKYDEAHTFQLSATVAAGRAFPLLTGGTSLGIERPALDVYLNALALRVLGHHPEALVWLQGSLGVLATALTFALGRQLGGPIVGLWAALFMAANPWLVQFDRKLWAHIQVLFSVALLWLAWQGVVRRSNRALVGFCIAAALQLLTHVLALLQVLSWLAAVAIAPRRWWRKETLIGLSLAALLLLPYAVALLNQPKTAALAGNPAPALADNVAWRLGDGWGQLWQLVGGSGIMSLVGARATGWYAVADAFAWLVLALTLLGIVRLIDSARRAPERKRTGARLVLAWGLGPWLALSLGRPVYLQYWTVLLPLPALFFAVGSTAVLRWMRRWRFAAGLTGVGLAALMTLAWVGSYGNMLSAARTETGDRGFGVPLARWQAATEAARQRAGQLGLTTVQVALPAMDPRYEDDPAVVAALFDEKIAARFVKPSSSFALVDPRYELEPAVLALVAEHLPWPYQTYPSFPDAMQLSAAEPTLILWAIDRSDIEPFLRDNGQLLWEGGLAASRPAVRLYELPTRQTLWQKLARTSEEFAAGYPPEQVRIATNGDQSELLAWLPAALPPVLLPSAAADQAAAASQVADFVAAGVRRVVFVDQPSGWWDNDTLARTALAGAYTPVLETTVGVWPVVIYERAPAPLPGIAADFTDPAAAGVGLKLAEAALTAAKTAPGGVVGVHLLWQQPSPPLPDDLKITLQLLDGSGALAAQVDQPWTLRDKAGSQSYAVLLPATLPAGEYRMVLALYHATSGQRLVVAADHVDYVILGTVHIN